VLLVAIGGIGLASKGLFAKLLYARGVDVQTVLVLRTVLAMPGFVLVGLLFGSAASIRAAPPRVWLLAMAGGFMCYYVGASLNFFALSLIDASIERALLFSYPALVVMANSVIRRRLPSRPITLAILVTWLGIALVVGLFDSQIFEQNLTGAVLVLICGATMAFYLMVTERVTRSMSSAAFTTIAMTTAALCFVVQFAFRGSVEDLQLDGGSWLLMAGLVIFATIVPLFSLAEGVRRVGAQRGAVVSTVGPPATILMAAIVLGERMEAVQIVGVACILAGILVLELRGRAPPPQATDP
jgi:drug/metabolite transporter (DMT)-like permease